ncbi:transposase [Paenibacillus borealis]
MLNAMLWVARTGAPWRDMPEHYGSWSSVYTRFRRWQKAAVWDRILEKV